MVAGKTHWPPGRASIPRSLARALLLAFATEHRRIQVEREALLGTGDQAQKPAPERPPELLEVGLGEAEEEMADGVITGENVSGRASRARRGRNAFSECACGMASMEAGSRKGIRRCNSEAKRI